MSYEKQNWQTGDTITAEKLNHLEDGVAVGASGTLVIGGFSYDGNNELTGTSDKTWQEIDNALAAGARCIVVGVNIGGHGQTTIWATSVVEGAYFIYGDSGLTAKATSADGFPSIAESDPVV